MAAQEPAKKQRRPRHDTGSVKATPRDTIVLPWIGEMYAVRFDQVVDLVARYPGPGVAPSGLSESAVRQVVDRWRRAGWIGYQQFLANAPPWLWLTRAGLAAFDLSNYKPIPPAISRLRHIHLVNTARLQIERSEDTWISERAIRSGLYAVPQLVRETRHVPDGILCTPTGDFCIEIELTQKKPTELAQKMQAVLLATKPDTYTPAYEAIWYYTPDPRIKKALEAARETNARVRYIGKRAEAAKIVLFTGNK